MRRMRRLAVLAAVLALAAVTIASPATADHPYLTAEPPAITLDAGVPAGSMVKAIINSGETYHEFRFQGIPDGIGIAPGPTSGSVNVFVTHEETHVPFFGTADFQDASVSKLTLLTGPGATMGAVVGAEVALPATAGYLRFCSAFMAGPDEGFANYTFFVNEEANDVIDVPDGAPYGADPDLDPQRQSGYLGA